MKGNQELTMEDFGFHENIEVNQYSGWHICTEIDNIFLEINSFKNPNLEIIQNLKDKLLNFKNNHSEYMKKYGGFRNQLIPIYLDKLDKCC